MGNVGSDQVSDGSPGPSGIERLLVTVFVADFVGFSRLMAEAEEATVHALKGHRSVLDGIIELHGGRIFNTAGDSILAEFRSPVEAVRSAVEIQDALRTRNLDIADDRRLELRIGIHLGDVIVRGSDFLGDGVNIAARLQSIAEPGGICISSSVHDQLLGKLDLRFDAMGPQTLKNIPRPIHAFRMNSGARVAPTQSTSAAPRRKRTGIVAAAAALALVVAAAGWWAVRMRPAPATARHDGSQARVVHALTEADRNRAQEAAMKNQLTLPPYQIPRPADTVPEAIRRFVGIWYNEVGFQAGAGRQVMLIVTNVDADGDVSGLYMLGLPGPKTIERTPGLVTAYAGRIEDRRLTFHLGRSVITAEFTAGDRLYLVHARADGLKPSVILNPIWRLEE